MGNLLKIFHSPREVFQSVDQSPHWVAPLVLVVVITLVMTAVILPTVVRPNTMEMLRSRLEGSEEQLEQALRMMSGSRFYVMGMVSALVTSPLKMLAQAGIFALILPLLGGKVDFRKILGATAYSAVVSAFGGVVKGGIMLGTRSMEAYTNFNLFLPSLAKDSYLYRLFTAIDFFTIWSLVLFGLGLSIVGKIDRGKSHLVVFVLWFALIFVFSYFAGIIRRLGG